MQVTLCCTSYVSSDNVFLFLSERALYAYALFQKRNSMGCIFPFHFTNKYILRPFYSFNCVSLINLVIFKALKKVLRVTGHASIQKNRVKRCAGLYLLFLFSLFNSFKLDRKLFNSKTKRQRVNSYMYIADLISGL